MTMRRCRYLLLPLLTLSSVAASVSSEPDLAWEARTGNDDAPAGGEGRHHPITFANETHGFVLSGTTPSSFATSDFYLYDEASDTWTDLTSTASAFPGRARSFGYGVALPARDHPKAYVGFGAASNGDRLSDLWEFDMVTHAWTQLASMPAGATGRRHPAMNAVYSAAAPGGGGGGGGGWQIHVGLGDGVVGNSFANLNDFWSYSVESDSWRRLPDFPSSRRHHPYYFAMKGISYAGLGHSDYYIERDFFGYDTTEGAWRPEKTFASYDAQVQDDGDGTAEVVYSRQPVTTEARVAGTQFSIEMPLPEQEGGGSGAEDATPSSSSKTEALGFVLSGDGDDHRGMATGEFHAFYPGGGANAMMGPEGGDDGSSSTSWWRRLPPHPGRSRWAPGSFVMRGTARAYFTGGLDRASGVLYADLWRIDLSSLFSWGGDIPGNTTVAVPAPTLSPIQEDDNPDNTPVVAPAPTPSPIQQQPTASSSSSLADTSGSFPPSTMGCSGLSIAVLLSIFVLFNNF